MASKDYEFKTEAEITADSMMRMFRELAESKAVIKKLKSDADYWRNKSYPVLEDNGNRITMHMLGEEWVRLEIFEAIEAEVERLRRELNDRGVFHAETETDILPEAIRGIQENLNILWDLLRKEGRGNP